MEITAKSCDSRPRKWQLSKTTLSCIASRQSKDNWRKVGMLSFENRIFGFNATECRDKKWRVLTFVSPVFGARKKFVDWVAQKFYSIYFKKKLCCFAGLAWYNSTPCTNVLFWPLNFAIFLCCQKRWNKEKFKNRPNIQFAVELKKWRLKLLRIVCSFQQDIQCLDLLFCFFLADVQVMRGVDPVKPDVRAAEPTLSPFA